MIYTKKNIGTTLVLLISGMAIISGVSADEDTIQSSDSGTMTQSSTTSSMENSTSGTSFQTQDNNTISSSGMAGVTPTTTSTSSVDIRADRNNDGSVDMFEQCAFIQKQPEANCSSIKETMKKKMWEQYGSGTYNPNAFERNQNGGIMMKEMNKKINSEKKEMNQQIKDDERKMMKENEQNRQMMGSGAKQINKDNRQEFKEGTKQQKQEFKKEVQAKKQALSEKLHTQLTTAVEKLPVEKLNRVLVNIDKAVTKIESSSLNQEKKDNLFAQLEEIRTIIQDKIDILTGTSSNGINLNDILGGTTIIDTTTNTGAVITSTNTTTGAVIISGTATR